MRRPGRPKGKKNGWKYLNESQLKKLMTAVERGKSLRDEVMMKLALWLGLRVKEICNIKLEHINPDSQEIFIEGAKNGRKRTYQFVEENEKLWKKLSRYITQVKKTNSIHLFPNPRNPENSLTIDGIKRLFKVYAKKAGLPSDFSIHSLRHSCAMIRAKNNSNPIKIMLWLRHRSIKSTQRYFEQVQFENDSRDTAEQFAEYL